MRASNRSSFAEDEGGGFVRIIDVDVLMKDVDLMMMIVMMVKV